MPTASHTLSPSDLFRKAWAIARLGARHFGGRARAYFNTSLKQAWDAARTPAAAAAAMRARVRASIASPARRLARHGTAAPTLVPRERAPAVRRGVGVPEPPAGRPAIPAAARAA
jgi:hypothetical protein